MPTRILCALLVFILFDSNHSFSQDLPPVSDPQAVALARQVLAALTNGVPVSDMTLKGNATWIAGSEKGTGTVTLKAKGLDESRIDLNIGAASRSEERNDSADPMGQIAYSDGRVVPEALHNTKTAGAWFAPAVVLSDFLRPDALLTYVGRETYAGTAVEHIRMYRVVSGKGSPAAKALITRLSTMDLRLDGNSMLPILLSFAAHPEDDAGVDIAVDIGFSNYQKSNSVMFPQHVTRFLQNSVNFDITITSIDINSGLPDTDFTIQNNGGGQ
jgi:hypothetical protein